MSFRIYNNNDPNIKRSFRKDFEIVKSSQDLNPLVSVTRLHTNIDGSYDVYLPATQSVGQKKIIELVNNDAGNSVTVYFPNAADGSSYSQTMDVMGDLLVLYSTPVGWHVLYRLDWY